MKSFPIETFEFFEEYRQTFGMSQMKKLFAKGKTTIYKWCANPATNGETRINPLDTLEKMISNLIDAGQTETAQRLVDRLARKVGGELSFRNVKPDKDSFLEETLDISLAISRFNDLGHRLLKNGEGSKAQVRDAKKYSHMQLDEAMAALELECKSMQCA